MFDWYFVLDFLYYFSARFFNFLCHSWAYIKKENENKLVTVHIQCLPLAFDSSDQSSTQSHWGLCFSLSIVLRDSRMLMMRHFLTDWTTIGTGLFCQLRDHAGSLLLNLPMGMLLNVSDPLPASPLLQHLGSQERKESVPEALTPIVGLSIPMLLVLTCRQTMSITSGLLPPQTQQLRHQWLSGSITDQGTATRCSQKKKKKKCQLLLGTSQDVKMWWKTKDTF